MEGTSARKLIALVMIMIMMMIITVSSRELNDLVLLSEESSGVSRATTPGVLLSMAFPSNQEQCGGPCGWLYDCSGPCHCFPGPFGFCVPD